MDLTLKSNSSNEIVFPFTNITNGTTIVSAKFVIKNNLSDLDADAVYTSTITTVLSSHGIIGAKENPPNTVPGWQDKGVQKATFYFLESELTVLVASTYVWAVKVKLSGGTSRAVGMMQGSLFVKTSGVTEVL